MVPGEITTQSILVLGICSSTARESLCEFLKRTNLFPCSLGLMVCGKRCVYAVWYGEHGTVVIMRTLFSSLGSKKYELYQGNKIVTLSHPLLTHLLFACLRVQDLNAHTCISNEHC